MSTLSAKQNGWFSSNRLPIAIAGCALGLGFILLGFGAVTKSQEIQNSAETNDAPAKPKKTLRAWNMALGDVVVLAQELGFEVKGDKDQANEPGKISVRIESQLQRLREFYRQESENNSSLMGGMMLQLTVDPSGEVSEVKELASRIADSVFKKAVIAQVSKWSFHDVVSDNVTINCPLLFVREGMDITTLVQWERSLAHLADKPVVAHNGGNANSVQQSKAPATSKPPVTRAQTLAPPVMKAAPSAAAKPDPTVYEVKYVTSVRPDPNFASPSVAKFSTGTKVSLISKRGDWLEVRAEETKLSGFIRKEFVTPVEMARKQ